LVLIPFFGQVSAFSIFIVFRGIRLLRAVLGTFCGSPAWFAKLFMNSIHNNSGDNITPENLGQDGAEVYQ
jgi:hypothetical protein